MKALLYGNEKFTYDNHNKAIYVDNTEKGTRAVFWVTHTGSIIQKTKLGCSARGLLLAYKELVAE